MDRALAVQSSANPSAGGVFFILAVFYRENGPVESFMQWALTSSFEHSNRELLALYIYGNMNDFVDHKGSLGVLGASLEVPGASLGRLRDVPAGPRGVPGRPRGVPVGPRGTPQERPRGSQGRAQGIPRMPRGSGDVPGVPGILFIKMIP